MGLIERLKQFNSNLTPAEKILYAGVLAQLIGLGLNGIYAALSPKNKAKWEKHRGLHHGDWGYLIALYGDTVNNPAIMEFGNKLRGTDREDEKEWIFKDGKERQIKPSTVKVKLVKKDDRNPNLVTIKLKKKKPQA